MELTAENKAHIDAMSYEGLLEQWRNAPSGSPWFQGETGTYWGDRMKELREKGADHVGASWPMIRRLARGPRLSDGSSDKWAPVFVDSG